MAHYNQDPHQGIHHYLNLIHKHDHFQHKWVYYTTILQYKTHLIIIISSVKYMNCTLTVQPSALHMHGAVLGPLHTVRIASLLVSLHKQLAVESHIIILFE